MATPVLDATAVLEKLRARQSSREGGPVIRAMYSSLLGGIVTDPALMQVPIDDHMVHRGHGVFDTSSFRSDRLYRLQVHTERLLESAAIARIKHSFTASNIMQYVTETARASGLKEGSIRMWLTAGPGDLGLLQVEEGCFYCIAFPLIYTKAEDAKKSEGVTVATVDSVPLKPILLATTKSNNYLLNALLVMAARDKGAEFPLQVRDGFIAEGARKNVFFVLPGGRLVTPNFDGVLAGCTARRVLEFGAQLVKEGVVEYVEQRGIPIAEAKTAKEMFLTGGDLSIIPVRLWDTLTLEVGPVYRGLHRLLQEELEAGGGEHFTAM